MTPETAMSQNRPIDTAHLSNWEMGMGKKANEDRPVDLTPADMSYLDGLLDGFSEINSDYRWMQMCQDAIRKDSRFAGMDAFEVWAEWAEKPSTDLDAA